MKALQLLCVYEISYKSTVYIASSLQLGLKLICRKHQHRGLQPHLMTYVRMRQRELVNSSTRGISVKPKGINPN